MVNKTGVSMPGIKDNADDHELVYVPNRGKYHTGFGMVSVGELRAQYKRKQEEENK
ncbi:hypothetical protein [Halobacillus ihumii]|uniref:hypothetical protein n=1 Tax=Halobacillus ihumii TaxID=2686092 RepID=UPI0013D2FB5D|nr:hypothetical protein [Halobacillus ihumii]